MNRPLRDVRQAEAVRAFVRLGGIERPGKGSHRVVNLNGYNLSIPHGILKIGLLTRLIKLANISTGDFLKAL